MITDGLARWLGAAATLPKLPGSSRCTPVADSLQRAQQVAARAGVTRVANVTGLDTVGLPVVAVFRPNARSLVVSQGKGLDLPAATVSGLMEAIESHHAEHPQLPLTLATRAELSARARANVVDVASLPRAFGRTLPDARALLWAQARELHSDAQLWVPFELVHTNFTLPLPSGSGTFLMSSNGLASGNHTLEAISHGLCELIERDGSALFAAAGGVSQRRRRVELASIDDHAAQAVVGRLHAAGLAVGVWDITSDLGLAAFSCVVVEREDDPFRPLYYASGSGCHPSRQVALLRALTEAAQCRLTYIAGARDDGDRAFFARARNPDRIRHMRELLTAPSAELRQYADVPSRELATIEADVAWQLECLQRAGLREVLVVDLGLPDFEIPVVRVIVPGLESLHGAPGYTPGARALATRRGAQA